MWLSTTAQSALRAVLHLAEHGGDEPLRSEEIARALDAPPNYLSKTLHALARAGVVRSTRGPAGGFRLAHDPARLTLQQVIAPFTPAGERRCLLGRIRCNDRSPCPAHHRWSIAAGGVESFLEQTSVADLVGRTPT